MLAFRIFIACFCTFITLFFYTPQSYAACPEYENARSVSGNRIFILSVGANTGDLKLAEKDAHDFERGMKNFLVRTGKHNVLSCVLTGTDTEFYSFEETLDTLKAIVKITDTVYFYFSGHGILKTRKGKNGQSICHDQAIVLYHKDKKIKQWKAAVKDDDLVHKINALNTFNISVFLDTCFSGGFKRSEAVCKYILKDNKTMLKNDARNSDAGFVTSECPFKEELKGTLYTATKHDKKAYEISGGGLFTQTFLSYLKESNSIDEAFAKTQAKLGECGQNPQKYEVNQEIKNYVMN